LLNESLWVNPIRKVASRAGSLGEAAFDIQLKFILFLSPIQEQIETLIAS
jgi:hypothetical protein